MKKTLLILAGLSIFLAATGKKPDYNVDNIPETLLENANAVVRELTCDAVIVNDREALYEYRQAVTVLNEHGRMAAFLVLPYSKYIKVRNIHGTIYDSEGNKHERIATSDILDFSNIASYSLFEDQRIKVVAPDIGTYPYTVEYTYEIQFLGSYVFPSFAPVEGYNIAVQKAVLNLSKPEEKELEFKVLNVSVEPEVSNKGGQDHYTWKISNYGAKRREAMSGHAFDVFPIIMIRPYNFEFGGVKGSQETWKDFGAWIWKLVDGKDSLPADALQDVKELVEGAATEREIVSRLYTYMQDRVRYVNIAIGLGGLEPIPAATVHQVGYGDCKALSNYMRALLKAAGIESVYTLVYAGDVPKPLYRDFPSAQFNHAILMVPLKNDSIWLECTSNRFPAGYLGSFTDDREVLHITPDGGVLGHTPLYNASQNTEQTVVAVSVDPDLNAHIVRSRTCRGVLFGECYSRYLNSDDEARKRRILKSFHLSGFVLDSFRFDVTIGDDPVLTEYACVSDDGFLTRTGDYISLQLNSVCEEIELPQRIRNRSQDIHILRGKTVIDSVAYSLPEGLKIAELPENESFTSDFGECSVSVSSLANKVTFRRILTVNAGDYKKERYDELFDFFRKVKNMDSKVALLKLDN